MLGVGGAAMRDVLLRQLAGVCFDGRRPWAVAPLHVAVLTGHVPLVAMLLRAGARGDCVSTSGTTPAACAAALTGGAREYVEGLLRGH